MSMSPTALKIGGGIAAAATAGAITFVHGQKNDATPGGGEQTAWDKKVVGTNVTGLSAVLVGAGLAIATQGTSFAGAGAALGVGVLFGGLAGAVGGFLGSMAVG